MKARRRSAGGETRPARPIEVAIVGGGCAGITAAFELTRPEHRGRYEVTVYQQGWRLGGKGASGRGEHGRIEEHGLHVWMGFYENSFRLLRECYAELGRDPRTQPMASWRDAFFPSPWIGLTEEREDGGWDDWTAFFPPMPGLPGDPLSRENPLSVSGYLVHAVRLLATLIESARRRQGAAAGSGTSVPELSALTPDAVLDGLARLVRYGHLATLVGVAEAMRGLDVLFGAWSRHPPGRGAAAAALRPLESVIRSATRLLSELARGDAELRRAWAILDLLLTVIRGSLRFGLVTDPRGFDAVDDYDFREWLALNGASRAILDSAFLRGVGYDEVFAYEDGDPARPRISAGQSLRTFLRMLFTYRGALFWKMRAGMGDAVFAPFYEVLRRRGVRFEFFHRLEALRLVSRDELRPGERPWVEALEIDVQATVRSGAYEPLVDVRGLPCWPMRPDYAQLADGERLEAEGWNPESWWDRRQVGRKTLRVGEDFDFVVLAVGLGAIPHVAADLLARDRRWRRLAENVKTVETGAFQLWLQEDVAALGWPGAEGIILTAYVKPYDTWADMTHLLSEERWPRERTPRSLAYFCGALESGPEMPSRDDLEYPAVRREAARREAVRFLERHVGHLWPRAVRPEGGFRWELLVPGAQGPAGPERFATQYWTANVNPSDRYVLTLPGTAKDRISPLDNTYDNLTVAGDWTACGLTLGCVESAVISGRLAAHALSGWPRLEDIVGFDHP
ncbi:MAG TPA: FAD-dependent oxidoreductase [Thermoanaerobaculia bacterium]